MSEQPVERVEAGDDPVADDTDHEDYLEDMDRREGASEDGEPVDSEWDDERGTAS